MYLLLLNVNIPVNGKLLNFMTTLNELVVPVTVTDNVILLRDSIDYANKNNSEIERAKLNRWNLI